MAAGARAGAGGPTAGGAAEEDSRTPEAATATSTPASAENSQKPATSSAPASKPINASSDLD